MHPEPLPPRNRAERRAQSRLNPEARALLKGHKRAFGGDIRRQVTLQRMAWERLDHEAARVREAARDGARTVEELSCRSGVRLNRVALVLRTFAKATSK
jgi:hypothetical protein